MQINVLSHFSAGNRINPTFLCFIFCSSVFFFTHFVYCSSAVAQTGSCCIYSVTVTNVVDGDTFDGIVHLGFGEMRLERFRLYGIDAWEVRGNEKDKGKAAKKALSNWIKDRTITVEVEQRWKENYGFRTLMSYNGKYGRPLCILFSEDKVNINLWMVKEGHATEYYE